MNTGRKIFNLPVSQKVRIRGHYQSPKANLVRIATIQDIWSRCLGKEPFAISLVSAIILLAALSLAVVSTVRNDKWGIDMGRNLSRTLAGESQQNKQSPGVELVITEQAPSKPGRNKRIPRIMALPPYYAIILRAAIRHEIDPDLVRAVIRAESSYNPQAVSKSGARGLMQLMPKTAQALGVADSLDPEHNINGGVKYLRRLLDRFNGDVRLALAAYNAGSRNVRKYNGIPPFAETRQYVAKVMNYYEEYQLQ